VTDSALAPGRGGSCVSFASARNSAGTRRDGGAGGLAAGTFRLGAFAFGAFAFEALPEEAPLRAGFRSFLDVTARAPA
jgi:hypothetical protein